MNASSLGLLAGLLLAIAAVTGGWLGFLLGIVLGGVGLMIAGQLSGEIDLAAVGRGRSRG